MNFADYQDFVVLAFGPFLPWLAVFLIVGSIFAGLWLQWQKLLRLISRIGA